MRPVVRLAQLAKSKQAKGEIMHFKAELELFHLLEQNTGARK